MIAPDRRSLLKAAGVGALVGLAPAAASAAARNRISPLIIDIERRAFDYFWTLGRADNGLVPDRWPTPSFCSIAAVGFALTAYPIGVERGWISRAQAIDRTLATLRFFASAPQGPQATDVTGNRGFFYHFIEMKSGLRYRDSELSSVDSTLLFLGMMFAGQWYDRPTAREAEIRRLADAIVERADWRWFQRGRADVSMGWHPGPGLSEGGEFIERGWTGYNEGKMVVLLALGARRHPVADGAWQAWCAPYADDWRGEGDTRHLAFAPLFGHQYSECWIDFRGIRDPAMRHAGFDYAENARRATHANRAYCAANPMGWDGYSSDIWGLSACDGPGNFAVNRGGVERPVHGYAARGPIGQPDGFDDGTIAPTAAVSSIGLAPEIAIPAIDALHRLHGARLYRRFGFLDSFNPSLRDPSLKLETGSIDSILGWVASDWLGINQGPMVAMIANHRQGTVWRQMRRAPTIRRGLLRAGFSGGWLSS